MSSEVKLFGTHRTKVVLLERVAGSVLFVVWAYRICKELVSQNSAVVNADIFIGIRHML